MENLSQLSQDMEFMNYVNILFDSYRKVAQETKPVYRTIIELSVKNGIIFVRPTDIIRLEASRCYTVFHLVDATRHVVSKSLKEYETLLDPKQFYRCHPSHVVNLAFVSRIVSNDGLFVQMKDGSKPDLLKRNKREFLERLQSI